MDNDSQYFISLLTSFLKNTALPKPLNIDWCKIYDLSSIHSLSGAIYLVIQKMGNDDKPEQEVLNKFKSDFFYATMRYEEQEKAYKEITKKLNDEKIDHLFFKGIIIREYYEVKQMRILGDIDLLVHKKDQDAVRKVFNQMGYKCKSEKEHEKYFKGKVLVEAHDKIINNQINSKVDYFAYFENAWDHARIKENSSLYELNMEYHLVFLLAHIAKHFYSYGAGVRMILDIAMILIKFGDSLNFSYIWRELKEIKLDIFARNIFGLCDRWFQVKTPNIAFDMDDITFKSMSKYILDGGTFGFSNNNFVIHEIRSEYPKSDNRNLAQFGAFRKIIFWNFKTANKRYPILSKYPYLLPYFWIHRAIKGIIKKPSKTLNILKGIFVCSEEAEQTYDMMKKIGL